MKIRKGTIVRDRKWGGQYTGTVVRVSGGSIFVKWHGSFVEDELSPPRRRGGPLTIVAAVQAQVPHLGGDLA